MHRVPSAGNATNLFRARKEKRLTYVLNDADNVKVMFHFFSSSIYSHFYLLTGYLAAML